MSRPLRSARPLAFGNIGPLPRDLAVDEGAGSQPPPGGCAQDRGEEPARAGEELGSSPAFDGTSTKKIPVDPARLR